MGNKGPTRHLKRHQSPSLWPIPRKTGKWAIRTSPGPHKLETSIPITILLRNELGYAETAKEAKIIVKEGKVLVDGRIRWDEKFPLGLMDVLSLPLLGEHYRVLPDHGGKLRLLKIDEVEANRKLCKITGKSTIKGGNIQLNLHDGKNLSIQAEADRYNVDDVLVISLPEKEIQDHIEFKEMQQAIIIGGKSQGAQGLIIGLGPEPGWKKTATLRTPDGEDIRTLADYVFVVGTNTPVIKLNEGEE
ncbi:30S ribosomal protein S4e [Candidatus Bathyarchaeota archaeon]|jgi:small subunit ribosomal protein S4e|nr:30S ribosomal protein S4e [Candidatus Bathyarchaeota archaeon]